MKALPGVVLGLMFVSCAAAQDTFREISNEFSSVPKSLGCANHEVASDRVQVQLIEDRKSVMFNPADHANGRLVQDSGGAAPLNNAKITFTSISWETPKYGPVPGHGMMREKFSLDRKTGVLDALFSDDSTAPRHLYYDCSEDQVWYSGSWHYYYNKDHVCYGGFPKGIHSRSPIRVYVADVSLNHWADHKDTIHPEGYNYHSIPQNKPATDLLVSALNREALESRSDTSFMAADDSQNANLLANLTINFGINEGKDHRVYYANVDIGGMGLTGPMGSGPGARGQRSRIWGFYMEGQYEKYDVATPGEATQIAFREIARGVVNGWTCR
ncbi:MAG: hypothetical protein WCE73_00155 [Candidatus Angelobacter sp.]|jgi:hypothetical protein